MHEQCEENNSMEHSTSTTPKASNMNYGWYQILNNTAHHYQTPYNVALIVEQLSNYNVLLRVQKKMEKDVFTKQNNLISDESRHASKLCTSATEHMPKRVDRKSYGNDSKVNFNAWIKPKKFTPTTYFFKRSKCKEGFMDEKEDCNVFIDINNNQHKELLSEDEKEEDKECHTMANEDESSDGVSNIEKCKRVVMKSKVDESEYEEFKTESKVNQEIKVNKINVDENEHNEDDEKECAKCKINQENSTFTEAMHQITVSELKKELLNLTVKSDEEEF